MASTKQGKATHAATNHQTKAAKTAAGQALLTGTSPAPAPTPPPTGGSSAPTGTSPAPAGGSPVAAPSSHTLLVDLPLDQIKQAVQQGLTALATLRALLPNPTRLTAMDRKHSAGRLRQGESEVLQVVSDICANPTYAPLVASLAERDFGDDPTTFEPALLKERLQKVDALTPLADAFASFTEDMSDTALDLQLLARQPLLDAYAIFKTVAKNDPTLKALLKDVIDYYAAAAQAGAKTRKAKAAAPAAATPAAPTKA